MITARTAKHLVSLAAVFSIVTQRSSPQGRLQNILTSQPCLHTLMQTRLSANKGGYHLSYFINKDSISLHLKTPRIKTNPTKEKLTKYLNYLNLFLVQTNEKTRNCSKCPLCRSLFAIYDSFAQFLIHKSFLSFFYLHAHFLFFKKFLTRI